MRVETVGRYLETEAPPVDFDWPEEAGVAIIEPPVPEEVVAEVVDVFDRCEFARRQVFIKHVAAGRGEADLHPLRAGDIAPEAGVPAAARREGLARGTHLQLHQEGAVAQFEALPGFALPRPAFVERCVHFADPAGAGDHPPGHGVDAAMDRVGLAIEWDLPLAAGPAKLAIADAVRPGGHREAAAARRVVAVLGGVERAFEERFVHAAHWHEELMQPPAEFGEEDGGRTVVCELDGHRRLPAISLARALSNARRWPRAFSSRSTSR